MKRMALLVLAGAMAGGCASSQVASVEGPRQDEVLIGRIRSRARTVEVWAGGPEGVTYTSRGSRNEVKAERVSLEELREQDPTAAWFAETGWAARDGMAWASER